MNQLSTIDLVIVVGYIAATTLVGAAFARRQKDIKSYFVGDRNVGWVMVLVSIVATETSTVTFLSVPGKSFVPGGNFTFLQLALGYVIGRCIIAWLLLPQYFKGECYSAYEVLRVRFGPSVQRVASAIFLFTRTIADGLRLYLTALLLQQFTGWSLPIALIAMSIATIVYTFLGGMQAVIWTDLFQFVIYILGAIAALWFIVELLPAGFQSLADLGSATNRFQLTQFNNPWGNSSCFWPGLIGGAFFSMASHGADQIMVQRYLCAKSLRQARLALLSSGLLVFAQFALFLLIGVGLFALVNHEAMVLPQGAKPDEVFGHFIVNHLPIGLIGLVVAAVLAAAMSTLSSSLNSSANALVNDFYRPLNPQATPARTLGVSKLATIFFGIAQAAIALGTHYLGSERSIVDRVLEVAGLTTGLILGIFALGLFTKKVTSPGALGGLIGGATIVFIVWFLNVNAIFATAWPWYAVIGSLSTFFIALLITVVLGERNGSSSHRTT